MRPIIIDCDPGQDDAINILLALAAPEELDILGITTVAGNVPLEKTQRNARIMCELAGKTDVKVFAGCAAPMIRPLVTAEYVHGREGIDGAEIHEPSMALSGQHAVDFIWSIGTASRDEIGSGSDTPDKAPGDPEGVPARFSLQVTFERDGLTEQRFLHEVDIEEDGGY